MQINPYLNFAGNAKEAFDFYHSILGGELFFQPMSALPDAPPPSADEAQRTLHVCLNYGQGQMLMGSDCAMDQDESLVKGNNNYISLTVDSREEADKIFNGLSEGGQIEMPMADMFWGDYFGSLQDKYGVQWMISYPLPQ